MIGATKASVTETAKTYTTQVRTLSVSWVKVIDKKTDNMYIHLYFKIKDVFSFSLAATNLKHTLTKSQRSQEQLTILFIEKKEKKKRKKKSIFPSAVSERLGAQSISKAPTRQIVFEIGKDTHSQRYFNIDLLQGKVLLIIIMPPAISFTFISGS